MSMQRDYSESESYAREYVTTLIEIVGAMALIICDNVKF